MIRVATPGDASGILSIYAPYIRETSFTFETEVPTLAEFAKRIETYLAGYPWLVCEIDGTIAGYAYAAKHRERTAYQWCVESSVYVHDDFLRYGVGRALYTALVDILKLQEFRNVYAVINLPNDRSVSFHESLGFKHFADYKNVGYKLGRWKTVGWWELQLNDYIMDPPVPIKFPELNKQQLKKILDSASAMIKAK